MKEVDACIRRKKALTPDEILKSLYKKCDDCGMPDESVVWCFEPVAFEIADEKFEMELCIECYTERAQDI